MVRSQALTEEDTTGAFCTHDICVCDFKIVMEFRFTFDISDMLRGGGQEETVTVTVRDPTDTKVSCL